MIGRKTQAARLLAALEQRPVAATDFLLPDVVDGGPPILNFGGRLHDLRVAGHRIEPIGRRGRCKLYALVQDRQGVEPPPPELLDATVGAARPLSPYSPEADR